MRTHVLATFLVASLLGGCTLNLARVASPPESVAFTTAFPWNSMIYAARTDAGVVLIDLGWQRPERALTRFLARMDAAPEDVTDVFLTHSHRDHIGGWRAVSQARFHMAVDEVAHFEGRETHDDLPSRLAGWLMGDPAPWPGEVAVRPFSTDTAYVFGADTLRAFRVAGHTPGSAAYLFRGVLFAGDAIARSYLTGYQPAMRIFTDDVRGSRESLHALFQQIDRFDVQWVCTAHGKCARPTERFRRKVLR
jgi:hydroxyacylglutathione hydrolase